MSCYLYYEHNTSVIPDEEFDQLCKDLLANWDSIDHPHKGLVTKEDLEAGTGYSLKYPLMVKVAAKEWLKKEKGEEIYVTI